MWRTVCNVIESAISNILDSVEMIISKRWHIIPPRFPAIVRPLSRNIDCPRSSAAGANHWIGLLKYL